MAVLLSMALPGAGHWYLRRRGLATVEFGIGIALFATALWQLVETFLLVARGQAPLLDLLRICVPWALVLGGYSIADGLFTWMVSRRAIVPAVTQDRP